MVVAFQAIDAAGNDDVNAFERVACTSVDTITSLHLPSPPVSDEEREANAEARAQLEAEPV